MSNYRKTEKQLKIINAIEEYEKNKENGEDEIGITHEELVKKTKISKSDLRSPLYSLLNKGEIRISGISKNESNKFQIEYICFERRMPHKTFNEVLHLIYQLENPKDMMKVYEELLTLFREKIREYEKQELDYWKELNSKVNSMPIIDAINELKEEIKEKGTPTIIQKETKNQARRSIGPRTNHLIKELKIYSEWYNENKNARLWYFHDLSEEEIHKQVKVEDNKFGINRQYTNNQLKSIVHSRKLSLIDVNGSWTSEDFLNEKRIMKPQSRYLIEIKRMFREIIFYISSAENNGFLKNAFALALSHEEESKEFFEQFIKDISYINILKETLSENLNLNPINENDPYIRNAELHEEFNDKVGKRFLKSNK